MTLRVVFAGTPAFSCGCLEGLLAMDGVSVVGVVSQPDRRSGRGMKLTPSPVKRLALEAEIAVITPQRLRGNDEALAWLQSRQPDLLVVVAFGMILPDSWLETPKIAPLNVHASLLPRWRGAAPIERALLAGDTETGVCLMRMESGLDTGSVYAVRKLPITACSRGGALWSDLSRLGAELLVDALPEIALGRIIAQEQDATQSCYANKLESRERILDWQQSATVIDRVVRCFAPKPGARSRAVAGPLAGKWLKVLQGSVEIGTGLEPGSVALQGDAVLVGCGAQSSYRLLQVQPEGKQAMDALAMMRGLRGQGIVLG
ncbi:MAG: methionyl-tRNA formyltransferase [Mariprofundales bacterium]